MIGQQSSHRVQVFLAPSWCLGSNESVHDLGEACAFSPSLALFLHRVFAARYDLSLLKSFGKGVFERDNMCRAQTELGTLPGARLSEPKDPSAVAAIFRYSQKELLPFVMSAGFGFEDLGLFADLHSQKHYHRRGSSGNCFEMKILYGLQCDCSLLLNINRLV